MPIKLSKSYNISGYYSNPQEKKILMDLIDSFRTQIYDFEAQLNILDGKQLRYNDRMIVRFLLEGIKDLNRGAPKTNYTMFNFPDKELVAKAAVVVALIGEGILQLRNQVDYSDSGFSVAMFNKTGGYQGWAGFILQQYLNDKREFKAGVIPSSRNSGFVGIASEFGWGIYP